MDSAEETNVRSDLRQASSSHSEREGVQGGSETSNAVRVVDEKTRGDVVRVADEKTRGDVVRVADEKTLGDVVRVVDEKIRGDVVRVADENTRGGDGGGRVEDVTIFIRSDRNEQDQE